MCRVSSTTHLGGKNHCSDQAGAALLRFPPVSYLKPLKTMKENPEVALVLSGGGVKGLAHIGLLRALEEQGLAPGTVVGSSAGALVGALYAAEYSIDEMLEFFHDTPLFSFSMLSPLKPGLLDSDKYRVFLEKYFPGDRFEALPKALYVVTTNLEKGDWEVHDKGQLIASLLASASMPPLFSPVKINGSLHADGGVMNNFPVDPVLNQGLFIIGSNVCPLEQAEPKALGNSMALLSRSQLLSWQSAIQLRLPECDFLLEPGGINEINFLETSKMDRAYELGYHHAQRQMPKLLAALQGSQKVSSSASSTH